MLISEIYCSRQGEGLLTGTPSVFVRTSGCNLRCGFCDTPFASWAPKGEQLDVKAIMTRIENYRDQANHVVITGGEPLLPRQISELCQNISRSGWHITIETAGTIERKLPCDLMSISPKLENSDPDKARAGNWLEKHRRTRHRPEIVRQLMDRHAYQLKFVVDTKSDLSRIKDYLKAVNPLDRSRVLLMPQGVVLDDLQQKAEWLKPLCESNGFTFCPRMHIEWYGNKRGT